MKKMKLAVVFAALVSVVGFSSCLNSDGNSGPAFASFVTVTGDDLLGYKLYSDVGYTMVPTSQSVSQLPWLKNTKRALVWFDIAAEENPTQLEPNKNYNVVLSNTGSFPLFTNTVIDTYQNEPADTLQANQDPITSIQGLWAVKGYCNATIGVQYDPSKRWYMNAGYDSSEDVDPSTNTLTLTVYYDSNAENAYDSGSSYFSFKLPESEYGQFTADSINLVLRAKTTNSGDSFEEVKCRMAKSDLFAPRGY